MANVNSPNWLQWTTAILVIASLVVAGMAYSNSSNIPTANEIATAAVGMISIPEAPTVSVPTAEEIAAQIDVPETMLSLTQDLKADALVVCDNEFDFDEVEDLYGEDDEVSLVREYTDDRVYNIFNLGIDNTDDRSITVHRVYKVEVEPDIGDDIKDKVYVTCKVTSDDGELEADLDYDDEELEADLDYSL